MQSTLAAYRCILAKPKVHKGPVTAEMLKAAMILCYTFLWGNLKIWINADTHASGIGHGKTSAAANADMHERMFKRHGRWRSDMASEDLSRPRMAMWMILWRGVYMSQRVFGIKAHALYFVFPCCVVVMECIKWMLAPMLVIGWGG